MSVELLTAALVPGSVSESTTRTAPLTKFVPMIFASFVTFTVAGEGGVTTPIRIPSSALQLLFAALSEMARGNAVSLLPMNAELTTQQAADILNVSRPYLVGLLEKGDMPFRKVGVQRRVLLRDVVAYKSHTDPDRRAALNELAHLGQELGVGYEA